LKDNDINNFRNNIDINRYNILAKINVNLTNTTRLDLSLNSIFQDYKGPLDEATAVFMEYFYKNLLSLRENYRSSEDKLNLADDYFVHQALQSAQYLMSRDPKYSDPYYWAAFIAIN
jgi:hypothetical protein